jgi:hypothetical protein
MNAEATTDSPIDITETLVKLYVFLAQDLDRCLDLAARQTYPEHELRSHLSSTRATLVEMLSMNQVVKVKVEQECKQVLSLVAACLTDGAGKTTALDHLNTERAVLKNKIMGIERFARRLSSSLATCALKFENLYRLFQCSQLIVSR